MHSNGQWGVENGKLYKTNLKSQYTEYFYFIWINNFVKLIKNQILQIMNMC